MERISTFHGTHIKGDGMGKQLGFPTINLDVFEPMQYQGVFIVSVLIENVQHFGLLHLGPRPTFKKNEFRIEVFLFDFSNTLLYGTEVWVTLLQKIREVQQFSSPEMLIKQIKRDEVLGKSFVAEYLRKSMN